MENLQREFLPEIGNFKIGCRKASNNQSQQANGNGLSAGVFEQVDRMLFASFRLQWQARLGTASEDTSQR